MRALYVISGGLKTYLEEMDERLDDFTPVMVQATRLMEADIDEEFATGGHGLWAQHSPATIERWGEHPLLVNEDREGGRSVALRDTMRRVPEKFAAIVKTSDPVAHLHQYGTDRGIPARPFLLVSDETQERIDNLILDFAVDGKKGA